MKSSCISWDFDMKKKVAFICVHNSCRSQIAEALGKYLRGDEFDFYSAGTETKPQINQDAVRLMNKKKTKVSEEAPEESSGKIEINYLADIEHRLMRSLGRKVKITSKGKNKKITLEFRDEEDFEALVKLLDPEAID